MWQLTWTFVSTVFTGEAPLVGGINCPYGGPQAPAIPEVDWYCLTQSLHLKSHCWLSGVTQGPWTNKDIPIMHDFPRLPLRSQGQRPDLSLSKFFTVQKPTLKLHTMHSSWVSHYLPHFDIFSFPHWEFLISFSLFTLSSRPILSHTSSVTTGPYCYITFLISSDESYLHTF